jgi:hypothetical protein
LQSLHEAVARSLFASNALPTRQDWAAEADYWYGEALSYLEGENFLLAVALLRREAFDRASSPAVGALLAEIELHPAGRFRDGLERAVELLIEGWADQFKAAYEKGVREGRRQVEAAAEQRKEMVT